MRRREREREREERKGVRRRGNMVGGGGVLLIVIGCESMKVKLSGGKLDFMGGCGWSFLYITLVVVTTYVRARTLR